MYRYNYYYGYWSSDSDSEGGGDERSTPNLGEGGRDTDFSPNIPPPPPPPTPTPPVPPITATLVDTTPAILCLNETDEFNGSAAGYIPSGQFTEARAFPLSLVKATKTSDGSTKMVTVRNERTNYNYGAMQASNGGEIFRFPYYVPPGADLSTMPQPSISVASTIINTAFVTIPVNNLRIGAINSDGTKSDVALVQNCGSVGNLGQRNNALTVHVLNPGAGKSSQILNFTPGQFNEFLIYVEFDNAAYLNPTSLQKVQWMVENIKTSLPTGYQLEFKLQKNWRSYFGINVVRDINRGLIGTPNSTLANFNVTPATIGFYTLTNNWEWEEYNTAGGYKHWEIPVTKFTGNYLFDLPITLFPENDDFCSMEPTYKTPGPKAPWNLVSRHETFGYAQHWMRKSDYSQYIGPTAGSAVFYCPRNCRAVVWLKPGIANNDVI